MLSALNNKCGTQDIHLRFAMKTLFTSNSKSILSNNVVYIAAISLGITVLRNASTYRIQTIATISVSLRGQRTSNCTRNENMFNNLAPNFFSYSNYIERYDKFCNITSANPPDK